MRRSDPQAYHAMVATRSKPFADMASLSTPFPTLQKLNPMAAPPTETITSGTEDARMALLADMTTRLVDPHYQTPNTARVAGTQDPTHIEFNSPTLLPITGSNTRTRRSSASASPDRPDGTFTADADGMHDSVPIRNKALSPTNSATETSSSLVPHPSSKVLRIAKNAGRPMRLQDTQENRYVSAEGPHAHSNGVASTNPAQYLEMNFVTVGERTNGVSPILRKGTGAGFLAIISRKMPSLAVQNLYEAATPEIGQDVGYAVAQELERLLNNSASSNDEYRRQIRQQNRSLEENDVGLAEMLRRVEARRSRGGSVGKQSKEGKEGKTGAIDSGPPSSLPSAMQANVGTPPFPLTQPSSDPSGSSALATLRRWLSARKKQTDS